MVKVCVSTDFVHEAINHVYLESRVQFSTQFAISDVETEAELQAEPGDADDDPDPASDQVHSDPATCMIFENFTGYLSVLR